MIKVVGCDYIVFFSVREATNNLLWNLPLLFLKQSWGIVICFAIQMQRCSLVACFRIMG